MSRFIRLLALLLVVTTAASCGSPGMGAPVSSASPVDQAPVDVTPADVAPRGATFPRSAAVFLGQDELPPIDELAKYDLLVIDNDWANRKPRAFFDELRARNPRLTLLAYVNVVDSSSELGTYGYWRNSYKLWQLDPTTQQPHFPDQWLARTAAQAPVHEWEEHVMTNLTDQAPRVDGRLFVEYAVDWMVNTVWAAGIWDGLFVDVWGDRMWTADKDAWDIDRNGVDEPSDQIYGENGPWARGLAIGETRLRAALPDAVLVANGDRTLTGGQLNGRAFESFADPKVRSDAVSDVYSYIAAASSGDVRQPPTMLNINREREAPGSPAALRRARYELGATMLQDGYWAGMGAEYDELRYSDELDGGGRGRGYLGQPLEANPPMGLLARRSAAGTGSPADGVYRRDFDGGIVLVNTSSAPVTVALESTYTKLRGKQDPVVNDGSRVDRVTVASHDAIVLVR